MIKKLIAEERGDIGVGSILMVTVLLVFVIFPLSAFTFDYLRIQVVAGEVAKSIDAAVIDGYHSLDLGFMSKEEFIADNGLFEYYVTEEVKDSLRLNDDLTPKENSMLDGPLTLNSVKFYDSSLLPYTDAQSGKEYSRPFIEVEFTIRLKPLLYQQIILDALGKPYKEFSATRKASLPINN